MRWNRLWSGSLLKSHITKECAWLRQHLGNNLCASLFLLPFLYWSCQNGFHIILARQWFISLYLFIQFIMQCTTKNGEVLTAAFLALSLKPLVLLQCVNLNRSIAVDSVSLNLSCFWNVHKHRMTLAIHMLKYTRKRKTCSKFPTHACDHTTTWHDRFIFLTEA